MTFIQNPGDRCEYESCTKQPNYGYEGQRACYCSTHKLEGMVDVKHRYIFCRQPLIPQSGSELGAPGSAPGPDVVNGQGHAPPGAGTVV